VVIRIGNKEPLASRANAARLVEARLLAVFFARLAIT
jgi:hypothetical protein